MASGLKRDCIDKFYTKEEVVKDCLKKFRRVIKPDPSDFFIEPSAGDGAFFLPLREKYSRVDAYDIFPECEDVTIADFLQVAIEKQGTTHVIGNPPFGRQSSLAKKFIKKCCEFADSVSFVLPKSFKKSSFQKVFPLSFHLEKSIDLPENSFTLDGEDWDVPCVFQIWVKKDYNRELEEDVKPTYWSYVKKEENPDLSFRRVGVNAGKIDTEIETKSVQSHYFLKLQEISVKDFLEKYSNVRFDFENTVGPKSISKKELNAKLIKIE